jgi:2'-5' RNA ligase
MPETTRVFVAVQIHPANRAVILEFQTRLADQVRGLRWVPSENLHLTLAFLGDVPDFRLPKLEEEIAAAVSGFAPFRMTARGLGAFPNASRAQTVWVDLETAGPLLPLRSAVVEATKMAECPPPDDRFTPHVTIARANRNSRQGVDLRGPIRQYAAWSAGSWTVAEVVTFRSDPTPKGPIYSPLGRARLVGENSIETD